MAKTLATTQQLAINTTFVNSGDLSNPTDVTQISVTDNLTTGTGANQANQVWSDSGTVASGATTSLDLAGVLTDVFGTTLTFTKIKALYIRNKNTVSGDELTIGGNANAMLFFSDKTDKIILGPGGYLWLTNPIDGWTVTGATGDILDIANPGGGTVISYDIMIIGTV